MDYVAQEAWDLGFNSRNLRSPTPSLENSHFFSLYVLRQSIIVTHCVSLTVRELAVAVQVWPWTNRQPLGPAPAALGLKPRAITWGTKSSFKNSFVTFPHQTFACGFPYFSLSTVLHSVSVWQLEISWCWVGLYFDERKFSRWRGNLRVLTDTRSTLSQLFTSFVVFFPHFLPLLLLPSPLIQCYSAGREWRQLSLS